MAGQYECLLCHFMENFGNVLWYVVEVGVNRLPIIFKFLVPDVYEFVLKQRAWMIVVKVENRRMLP